MLYDGVINNNFNEHNRNINYFIEIKTNIFSIDIFINIIVFRVFKSMFNIVQPNVFESDFGFIIFVMSF